MTTLAPGASTTCTATAPHVITQADVDAGVVNNTATASRLAPVQRDHHLELVVDVDAGQPDAGSLQLTKSAAVTDANGNGKTDLGDTITWSFLVKNTGTVTASTVAVTDAKAGAVSCPVTTLAPGASTTCTAAGHTITQADVDAGVVSNTATAAAKAPSGATINAAPSSTDTPVAQTPALTLTKSAAVTDVNANGKHRPRRPDHLVVPGQEHRHGHGHDRRGQRRQGRRGQLPGDHPGAGSVDDLHVGGPRHHPGRGRRGRRLQHRDRDGQGPGERHGHLEPVVDRHADRADGSRCS